MSIKPVTYQGVTNFKANLYALEVKSRFIDQSAADGYYKGYGNELDAIVSSNIITVGSGAFLIQGRLNEIETGGESVTVPIQNGYFGYIVARIETYHPDDDNNCTLIVKTGAQIKDIVLVKEDTYQKSAESQNKVYELPIYSFSITNGAITNLRKLIQPIEPAAQALAKVAEVFALIYPVGSIYMSVNNTNPESLFGGSWEVWGAGRVPVGVNTDDKDFSEVEKIGGEKEHVLSTEEMPSHSHTLYSESDNISVKNDFAGGVVGYGSYPVSSTSKSGNGGAHNNLQPYITCYMWKRTA